METVLIEDFLYSFFCNLKLAPPVTRFVEATRVRASTSVKMEKLASEYLVKWVLADHTSTYFVIM